MASRHLGAWSEASSGGLLEAAPDAMVVIDATGIIVLVNAQTLKVFGYAREELLGQPVETLIPDSVKHVHAEHRRAYVEEPRVRSMGSGFDLLARRRDGSEFPVEISLSPLKTENGLLISAAIRDITLQRREERLFRGLLEAAPDAMVIVDADATIVLVNAQVERLFGYARTELIGQPIEVLVPARFGADHKAYRNGYLDGPRTRPMGLAGDLFAKRKDGTEFPVEISLAPLETDEGLLVSAAVRDISERKRLQERSDRLKDDFVATVSHELRTPLTSMIGYGELLAELEPLTLQGRRFLSVMLRSAERELRLVDDLLTLATTDESGLQIRHESLDLEKVLRDAVEAARPRAEEQGHRLSLEIPGFPVLVTGDADRLGQAMDNLLSNAIKFTPTGGAIRARLAIDADVATVEVSDSGPGIAEEDTRKIFERLYRAQEAVSQQIPGAGLGLTIALAIIQAHEGVINVPASDEGGTTIRIELPMDVDRQGV